MSAKSSNFAAEIVEIMSNTKELASRMTHTCYRCALSEFYSTSSKGTQLRCGGGHNTCEDINAPTKCRHWSPSAAVQSLLNGTADIHMRNVVIDIMNSRVANGTF